MSRNEIPADVILAANVGSGRVCVPIKPTGLLVILVLTAATLSTALAQGPDARISPQTKECLNCHSEYNPGLVQDWLASLHSRTTPAQALTNRPLARRISSENIPENLKDVVVGCYECHSLNATNHKDNFDHFDFKINVVVSPPDCQTCHAVEAQQFAGSKKAHALGNIQKNPVFHTMVDSAVGLREIKDGKLQALAGSDATKNDSCYGCHGSRVEVIGTRKLNTELGEVLIPKLSNWPNQGVGRVNPDGSMGACTACHPRHGFSIEVARKPFTCSQCHMGPDIPAWEVYTESKHGNIFLSEQQKWNWDRVPWRVGVDFRAPTCVVCHSALITSPEGSVIAQRTHDFGARLWVRLFGLPYSHPQPRSGDTTLLRNKDGQPLPTAFTGELASELLIDAKEQAQRQATMKAVCRACHNVDLVDNHFDKMESTIKETDRMTLIATTLMDTAWQRGLADKQNPFDEPLERRWMKQWLLYANSIRLGSAMMGPDHTSFEHGWFDLTTGLHEMQETIEVRSKAK